MKDNSYGVMLPFTRPKSPRWRSTAGGILIVLAAFGMGATGKDLFNTHQWQGSAPGARDRLIDPLVDDTLKRDLITILLRDAMATEATLRSLDGDAHAENALAHIHSGSKPK